MNTQRTGVDRAGPVHTASVSVSLYDHALVMLT